MSGNPYETLTERPVWQLSAALRGTLAFLCLLAAIFTGSRALLAGAVQPPAEIAWRAVMRFLPERSGRLAHVKPMVAAATSALIGLWLAGRGIRGLADPVELHALTYIFFGLLSLGAWLALAELPFRLDARAWAGILRARWAEAVSGLTLLSTGLCDIFFDWRYLDPIACLVIAGFLLWRATGEMQSLSTLWAPPVTDPDAREIKQGLEELPGITSARHIRIWDTPDGLALDAHLGLSADTWAEALHTQTETARMLREHTGFSLVTLHIDWAG